MIIWTGWGVAAILPLPLIALMWKLTETAIGPQAANYVVPLLGGGLAALFVWWLDRWRERRNPPRTLVDQQTGQHVVQKRRDSLFWIPLRFLWVPYGAISVFGVLGIFLAVAGM